MHRVKSPLKAMLLMAGMGVMLSLTWVLTYTIADPRGTVLMGIRTTEGQTIQKDWIKLEDVSPDVIRAVLAAEDTKFCQHHGFDLEQIRVALKDADEGKSLRGASTISQQTAKNAFLWPGGSFARKGAEAWFTGWVEVFWSKDRILEVYLNIAEWGDGYFGIEAAAQGRFGKSAANLTAQEAALLASVLPNPATWRVDPPGPYVRQRSGILLRRMEQIRTQGLDECVLSQRLKSHN